MILFSRDMLRGRRRATAPWAVRALCVGFIILVATIRIVSAQPARLPVSIPYGFPHLQHPSLDFGDIEGDGDLDLVITGETSEGTPFFDVYLVADSLAGPDGALFTVKVFRRFYSRSHPVTQGTTQFGDYDGDGDLDLLVTGLATFVEQGRSRTEPILHILENQWPPSYRPGGGLASPFELRQTLPGVYRSAADWGDYDGDGDLDFVVAGLPSQDAHQPVIRVYQNERGAFAPINTDLPGVMFGDLGWADIDDDGDLDLAVMGDAGRGVHIARVYRNEAGQFVDMGVDIPGLAFGSIEWGDYEGDGDPDLLIAGGRIDTRFLVGFTRVYRNTSGMLADAGFDIPGGGLGVAKFGDADRDGDLDLFVIGSEEALSPPAFRLYSFDGSGYFLTWDYAGTRFSAMAVGDYNGDGDADVALAGELTSGIQTRFFMNWDFAECVASEWVPRGVTAADCETINP